MIATLCAERNDELLKGPRRENPCAGDAPYVKTAGGECHSRRSLRDGSTLFKLTNNMVHVCIRAEMRGECRASSALHLFKRVRPQ